MSGWLDGIERVPNDHSGGGTYVDAPWRFVVHDVESDPRTVSDCRLLASAHSSPPHLWYSPRLGWYGQTVPLDRSAFALEHPGGTPETNKMRALQVEVFGFAAETQDWPAPWLDGIGYLIRRCINAGYPLNLTAVAETTGEDGYGTGGTVRFTDDQWRTFNGICGHANVPHNAHWDPGKLDLDAVAASAVTKPKEDDMTPAYARDLVGRDWLFYVADDRALWASVPQVDGGKPWPIGGTFTSGVDAWTAPNGELMVLGRGTDGKLYQVIIYTDGVKPGSGHRPGDPPWIGPAIAAPHHLYPPG